MASPSQFLKLRGPEQPTRAQDNIAGTLEPIAKALNATPIMGAPPPAWIPMSLVGGFAFTGLGQVMPEYSKDALGYVWVRGAIVNAAGCAVNTVFTTFPIGYRPSYSAHFAIKGNAATAQFVGVDSNGNAYVEVAVAAGGFTDMYFAFLAEQ